MSDLERKISQFQNMAQADPENEMAHFSLGSALVQAGRHGEAAACFVKCTELAPGMSKAFQLAAEAYLKVGDKDLAAQLATRGFTIAAERGDLMPKNALAELLKQLGRPVPEVAGGAGPKSGGKGDVSLLGGGSTPGPKADASGAFPAGTFVCTRTGRPGTKMTKAPFRGPVGEWIAGNISKETFDAWIAQGTKVINELRLDLSREQDGETYDENMREYLGIDNELHARLTGAASRP